MAGPEATYCARHPRVESRLGCSRCGVIICPRCMVQSDVGARCPDCARVRVHPALRLDAMTMARAIAAAVLVAGATGALWGLVFFRVNSIPYLPWAVALGIGYMTGQAVAAAVNRKRGRPLQYVAAAGVVASYVVASLVATAALSPALSQLALQLIVPDLFLLLAIVVGAYLAANRVG